MSFPTPQNEVQRLAALRDFQVLDTPPQKLYDDITELAANICDTPMGLISLIDADRQWFKSRHGVTLTETPRSEAICAHTIMDSKRVFVVSNAPQDPRFSDFPLVSSGVIRFYAGAPITTSDGHVLGAVCVLDGRQRELLPQQMRQLQNLADLAMNLIENDGPSQRKLSPIPKSAQKDVWTIKSVLDEGRDMCSFIDSQHRFQYVNPAYETHWGRPRASLIDTHVVQLVGRRVYEDVIKAGIDQALAGQEARLSLAQARLALQQDRSADAESQLASLRTQARAHPAVARLAAWPLDLLEAEAHCRAGRLAQGRVLAGQTLQLQATQMPERQRLRRDLATLAPSCGR